MELTLLTCVRGEACFTARNFARKTLSISEELGINTTHAQFIVPRRFTLFTVRAVTNSFNYWRQLEGEASIGVIWFTLYAVTHGTCWTKVFFVGELSGYWTLTQVVDQVESRCTLSTSIRLFTIAFLASWYITGWTVVISIDGEVSFTFTLFLTVELETVMANFALSYICRNSFKAPFRNVLANSIIVKLLVGWTLTYTIFYVGILISTLIAGWRFVVLARYTLRSHTRVTESDAARFIIGFVTQTLLVFQVHLGFKQTFSTFQRIVGFACYTSRNLTCWADPMSWKLFSWRTTAFPPLEVGIKISADITLFGVVLETTVTTWQGTIFADIFLVHLLVNMCTKAFSVNFLNRGIIPTISALGKWEADITPSNLAQSTDALGFIVGFNAV